MKHVNTASPNLKDVAFATEQLIRAHKALGDLAAKDTVGTADIDADAVTNAKLANMASGTLKGRVTAGTGDVEDLSPAQARSVLSMSAAFSASLDGVAGSAASATFTKLLFRAVAWNTGNYFDNTNNRWVPPAGKHLLTLGMRLTAGVIDQSLILAAIYRNGSLHKVGTSKGSGTPEGGAYVSAIVDAGGTDYFEAYVYADGGGGAKTIMASGLYTYFQGHAL